MANYICNLLNRFEVANSSVDTLTSMQQWYIYVYVLKINVP